MMPSWTANFRRPTMIKKWLGVAAVALVIAAVFVGGYLAGYFQGQADSWPMRDGVYVPSSEFSPTP